MSDRLSSGSLKHMGYYVRCLNQDSQENCPQGLLEYCHPVLLSLVPGTKDNESYLKPQVYIISKTRVIPSRASFDTVISSSCPLGYLSALNSRRFFLKNSLHGAEQLAAQPVDNLYWGSYDSRLGPLLKRGL